MERFFFGVANGSGKKALEQLGRPVDVMINYASKYRTAPKNTRWLFIDSGGFSFFFRLSDFPDGHDKYLEFVRRRLDRYENVLFANRDYPCEPEVRKKWGRTVRDNQMKTIQNQIEIMDLIDDQYPELKGHFVAVLQGWDLDDYLWHLDYMKEHGLLTEYLGLGTMCRRGQEKQIRRYILAIRQNAPKWVKLHAFGVKFGVLKYPDVREALYSADSNAYQYLISRNDHRPIWYRYLKNINDWLSMLDNFHASRQTTLVQYL